MKNSFINLFAITEDPLPNAPSDLEFDPNRDPQTPPTPQVNTMKKVKTSN
eukprot:CAMPEP_0117037150 /NCGR_PEP_ID=MMETSP0472-20121206/26260_1 /TAXON_ID=693140 ORGANISM="Tiarina fusus, Strain LIS" /NCGR_SAMPLE_ID=MMETSP0472 /ASSEMBLY_ACC=CAM_ASM_000603 /LENGTH=49 /DNA_ID=CAMNT_0004747091 /DNA_START=1142 /DNA_END=1291 /DNA_ORIENTATION=-